MDRFINTAFGGSPLCFVLRYLATIGYLLTLISACATPAHAQAITPEPPDSLSGIAVVLEVRMTLIPGKDGYSNWGSAEVVTPVHVWAVRYPIDMVPANLRGQSVGYVTRFFRQDDGAEVSQNDVLMFKIRKE